MDDLALVLDRADIAAVLADFGSRTRREDPVVHFYEDFLAAYDPQMREMRGVYYTPEPVVRYIVRSVDRLLRSGFGLTDGLADTATVAVRTPNGAAESSPARADPRPRGGHGHVPARNGRRHLARPSKTKELTGAWPDYIRDHLLRQRLFGFRVADGAPMRSAI